MTSGRRVLRCAVVMVAGLVLVPSAVVAAPVDPVPADTVPADTVVVDTVPADTVPVDPSGPAEGCAQVNDVVMCVGTPPIPSEPIDMPTAIAAPEAARATARTAVVAAAPAVVTPAAAPPLVASEAPVPARAPAAGVTLGQPAAPSVAALAVDLPAPVVPIPDETSPTSMVFVAVLLGALGALVVAAVAGFRRTRARS